MTRKVFCKRRAIGWLQRMAQNDRLGDGAVDAWVRGIAVKKGLLSYLESGVLLRYNHNT